MTTTPQSESTAKKDVTKLQRAIVDGLEDVKAQDIQVFNTEHLSPLFERVIVASGTSNRQTKALAASVRDAVRDAGFSKPRTEGEDNGEWIIVDCGAAVVHIMQPTIRQYYRLEELWGEKPVRLKLGAAKPVAPVAKVPAKTAARRAAKAEAAATEEGTVATAKKPAARKTSRSTTATPAEAPVAAKKPAARKTAPKKVDSASATSASPAAKAPAKRASKSSSAAPAAPAAKKAIKTVVVKPRVDKKAAPAKTTAAKKAPARKAAPRSKPE